MLKLKKYMCRKLTLITLFKVKILILSIFAKVHHNDTSLSSFDFKINYVNLIF